MAKKNKSQSEKELAKVGFYKGYEMAWLKQLDADHPSKGLVEEFEKKYGEIK